MAETLDTERRRFPWLAVLVVLALIGLAVLRVREGGDEPAPPTPNSLSGEENARLDGVVFVTEGWPMRLSRLDLRTGESSSILGLPSTLNQLDGLVHNDLGIYVGLTDRSYFVPWSDGVAKLYDAPGIPLRATADGNGIWYMLDDQNRLTRLRIVNGDEPTKPPITLPPRTILSGVTPHGLLIGSESYLQVWSPRSKTTVREFPYARAATDGIVVTAGSRCWAECPLTATDLRTFGTTRLQLKVGHDDELKLSEDGQWLAVQYADRQRPYAVSGYRVEDLRTGRVYQVPGYTPTRTGALSMDWTRDGQLAISETYLADSGDHSTIALWRPGDPQLKIVERSDRKGTIHIFG